VVVEKHGGTLTFETEEGKGTTFIVRLPLEETTLQKETAEVLVSSWLPWLTARRHDA
jgi:hypothetical protein